jgi:hypothetical protein
VISQGEDPGAYILYLGEFGAVDPYIQKDILDNVFGCDLAADDVCDEGLYLREIVEKESLECLLVSFTYLPQQFSFVM